MIDENRIQDAIDMARKNARKFRLMGRRAKTKSEKETCDSAEIALLEISTKFRFALNVPIPQAIGRN